MRKLFRLFLFAIFALAPAFGAAAPHTFIALHSQPGDYIGGGTNQEFTPADGSFSATTTFNGGVTVAFSTSDFSHWWYLNFGPPTGQTLARGEYEGAQRFAFHSPSHPGIDVYGDGRGCNTDAGRFLVSDIAFNQDGTVARLAIDFEQHCEGAPPALYGSVRFNSSATSVPRVSVGDATVLKGNAGTNSASVIVSLSLLSNRVVTVDYTTADGTGIEGTDYVATSGTVQFGPGTTSQAITVPVIGDRSPRGNKSFLVQLSNPNGAPQGDATGNVKTIDPNVPMTALAFYSQPGDYIGAGQLALFTLGDGTFTPSRNFDQGVSVSLQTSDSWNLDMAAPDSAPLTAGVYNHAQRFPFQEPGVPGLSFYGAGRGCNTLTGRFVVGLASYAPNGDVERFASDFEQHCEGGTPALFGSLRINANLRQISVSDAVIDSNGPSATFTVTLNPAAQKTVSVKFATADGTARAGTDYVATSQTVTFAPGEVEHTVTVPLLTQTGTRQFFGQLSAPVNAPVWISQGTATF